MSSMTGLTSTDFTKTGNPEACIGHGIGFNHSKMELFNSISGENNKNDVVQSKSGVDPARKKMFRITSNIKKGSNAGNGDVGTDNDADSVDGLDESQTEDFSSEFYDSSKATDLDIDIHEYVNMSPDEVTSSTTIKQKPDQNSQSRFRVVKIETKEPFRRGKWVCYDFYDTPSGAVVTLERNDSKVTEDNVIHSALSGNLAPSNSLHHVQNDNDSSSNIFVLPIVPFSPAKVDNHPAHSDVFVPIQPAPANQVLNQLDGLSSDIMAPLIAQQVLLSMANDPSSSVHNQQQSGHAATIQSLPLSNIFPYDKSGSPIGLIQNSGLVVHTSEEVNLPSEIINGIGSPTIMTMVAPTSSSIANSQTLTTVGSLSIPSSHGQTQLVVDTVASQGVSLATEASPNLTAGIMHIPQGNTEVAVISDADADQVCPTSSKSAERINGKDELDKNSSESLKEAVETVGEMYMGLEGNDDSDEGTNEIYSVLPKLPVDRPSTLPCHLARHNMDSPFGFCLTPIRSLYSSPVMEQYDGMVSMPEMVPVRFGTPTIINGFTDSLYNPHPIPGTFAHTDQFLPTNYFPALQPLMFSSGSAFVPLGSSPPSMPILTTGQSAIPVSQSLGISVPYPLAPKSLTLHGALPATTYAQSSSHLTFPSDGALQISKLSSESAFHPYSHQSRTPPLSTAFQMLNTTDNTCCDKPSKDDSGSGAAYTGCSFSNVSELIINTAHPFSDKTLPGEDR